MRRWARWVVGSTAALLAVTAVAHTSYGLRAVAWATGSDGCPFSADAKGALTAQAAEQLRVERLARGTQPAPARPALGFRLDVDRRSDVVAWAERHRVTCHGDRSGAGLRCDRLDASALPAPIADLEAIVSFGFDTGDRLVSVQLQSASSTAKERVLAVASDSMAAITALGPATSIGDDLGAPAFVRRETQVAFSDYTAKVIASNAGPRWMMAQTYQSIPKSSSPVAMR